MVRKAAHKIAIMFALCVGCFSGSRAAQPEPPLVLERTIPLADVSGRIDHMAIDLRRNRLLVAELGNGTVDVIDLTNGERVGRIKGLREPQGIAYVPTSDLIVVTSAGDGSVRLFQAADLSPQATIELGKDADNVRIDSDANRVVVGYGNGGLAIIDPARAAKIGDIRLPAHPEGFQLDPEKGLGFVNLPDRQEIAVVNLSTFKQTASWHVPNLRSNFPAALDDNGALAIVFRSPPRFVLLATDTGAVDATLETCGDADDVFFDAKRRRYYVSCGEGAVDVFQAGTDRTYPIGRTKTSSGARTSLFVRELDRLFVAARAGFFGSGATILVLRPVP